MKKLSDYIERLSGLGSGEKVSATLLKEQGPCRLYKRSDNVYEVFRVRVRKEAEVFGKLLPEREVYPSTEDFGKIAWCTTTEKRALTIFNELVEGIRLPQQ